MAFGAGYVFSDIVDGAGEFQNRTGGGFRARIIFCADIGELRTSIYTAMLAMMTAITPPADAPPTSKSKSACLYIKNARLVVAKPGPPFVLTNISAKTANKNIVSINTTAAIGRARCGSNVPKKCKFSRAVHLCGIALFFVKRLHRRQ